MQFRIHRNPNDTFQNIVNRFTYALGCRLAIKIRFQSEDAVDQELFVQFTSCANLTDIPRGFCFSGIFIMPDQREKPAAHPGNILIYKRPDETIEALAHVNMNVAIEAPPSRLP